jgi:hypothetical protein
VPIRPDGEIASLLISLFTRQVEGTNYVDGLEGALDNGMLFVNSPDGHRPHVE